MKISIINSYPTNSGDLALLEALIFGLKQHFSYAEILLHCNPKGIDVVKHLQLKTSTDLEYALFDFDKGRLGNLKKLIKRILLKIIGRERIITNNILPSRLQKIYIKTLAESKLVISGPGSYLTDIYNIADRIAVLKLVLTINKNLVLLSQSIGPFEKKKSLAKIKKLLPECRAIVLREELSLKYSPSSNSYVAKDICFLLANKYVMKKEQNKVIKNVVVSFRSWKGLDETKIVRLLDFLINIKKFKVTSISTCQGIDGYVDDARFLSKLKNENEVLRELIIDTSYNKPESLIKKYNNHDIYIGMRLHGAILSLIARIPAFVIGYEHKSEGVFNSLGLKKYQTFHRKSFKVWRKSIEVFLQDYKNYGDNLEDLITGAAKDAMRNVTIVKSLK